MSRLDDELRNAFRREQPPADFSSRLLERIAQKPPSHPRWWRTLASLFAPPKLRWVAIGVTASLLLAIGAVRYSKLHRVTLEDAGKVANGQASDDGKRAPVTSDNQQRHELATVPRPQQNNKPVLASPRSHRLGLARYQKERELRAEGEAAKEKLMLALSIASSTLNSAERAIRDERPRP